MGSMMALRRCLYRGARGGAEQQELCIESAHAWIMEDLLLAWRTATYTCTLAGGGGRGRALRGAGADRRRHSAVAAAPTTTMATRVTATMGPAGKLLSSPVLLRAAAAMASPGDGETEGEGLPVLLCVGEGETLPVGLPDTDGDTLGLPVVDGLPDTGGLPDTDGDTLGLPVVVGDTLGVADGYPISMVLGHSARVSLLPSPMISWLLTPGIPSAHPLSSPQHRTAMPWVGGE